MAWLARSIANSLLAPEEPDDGEDPLTSASASPTSPPRGVREDLSELTDALANRFHGLASFLAPPAAGGGGGRGIPRAPDPAEIAGRFRAGLARLPGRQAVADLAKIASSLLPPDGEDAEAEAAGFTEEAVAFARDAAMRPELWLDFPLLPEDDDADDFDMTDAQQDHALAVESVAPELADLRIELCPSHMSEGCFWKIYFVLLHPKLSKDDADLLSTPQKEKEKEKEMRVMEDEEFLRLSPPTHPRRNDDDDGGDALPATCLLDLQTYIADCQNATTATCRLSCGMEVQVTICAASPPLVSHVCVYCPGFDHTVFAGVPKIVATQGNVLVLCIALGPRGTIYRPSRSNYFLYQVQAGWPSLQLLPHPGPCFDPDDPYALLFDDHSVGILHYHSHIDRPALYVIAALTYGSMPGRYDLHLLHSNAESWISKRGLPHPHSMPCGDHSFSKVITVGGEAGTIGWVDLWKGILFCDVLKDDPVLRYVPLPPPLMATRKLRGCPRNTRDISVIKGLIRYVELQIHIKPGSFTRGNYISNGWTVATWSRISTNPLKYWHQDCKLGASQVSFENNPVHYELMPQLLDDQGIPQLTMVRLHTSHPVLSMHDHDTVYLMTKVNYLDDKAWVLAIDTRNNALQDVAEFNAERAIPLSYTFTQSGISEYLNMLPGIEENPKRQRMLLLEPSCKKQCKFNMILEARKKLSHDLQPESKLDSNEDTVAAPFSNTDGNAPSPIEVVGISKNEDDSARATSFSNVDYGAPQPVILETQSDDTLNDAGALRTDSITSSIRVQLVPVLKDTEFSQARMEEWTQDFTAQDTVANEQPGQLSEIKLEDSSEEQQQKQPSTTNPSEQSRVVIQKKNNDNDNDDDEDEWLEEETGSAVSTAIPIADDEDVSFSDLEEDDAAA
uniref:BSD domain-containing protein n=1 Tax=Oryza punctata TaxID=4537 RepID=A0A0E0MGB9_ORYPU